MRTPVLLLLVALLAVTCYGVSAQRPRSRGETGNTLLFAILDGNVDDGNCGGEGQPCCGKEFRCKAAGTGCVLTAAQKPTCEKCGAPNQPWCPGRKCNDGTQVASDALPYCPIKSTRNPAPRLRAKTIRRVVRQRRGVTPAGAAVAGAAVSAASVASALISDDIAAATSKSVSEVVVLPPTASTMDAAVDVVESPPVEEEVVEVIASAAEEMAMVDMSAGTLNRPCRTEDLWPGLPACDGSTCQFAGNGSPGICL